MTTRSTFLRTLAVAAALMLAPAMLATARADIYVVESSVAAIAAGSRLADSAKISIPAGGYIRAVLPSGKTQTIRGPYSGPVAELSKGQPRNEGVLAWIRTMLETGGSTEVTPGATRSIGREAAKVRAGFSWSVVPVTADGTVCIGKAGGLQLLRPPSSRGERVTVMDTASAAQGDAQWEPGSETAAWPAGVAARTGGVYYVMIEGRPRRQVTLQVLDPLPADNDVLTELHRLGCKPQFEAWVREKMAASKRGP